MCVCVAEIYASIIAEVEVEGMQVIGHARGCSFNCMQQYVLCGSVHNDYGAVRIPRVIAAVVVDPVARF